MVLALLRNRGRGGRGEGQATSLIVSSAWSRGATASSVCRQGSHPRAILSTGLLGPQGLPMLGPSHDFLVPVVRRVRKSIAQSDAKLSQLVSRHRLCPLELAGFGPNSLALASGLVIIAPLPTRRITDGL